MQDALDQRKSLNTENTDINNIQDVIYNKINNQFYVGLISKTDQKYNFHWTIISDTGKTKFSKIYVDREDYVLRGYVFYSEKNSATFLTLCKF